MKGGVQDTDTSQGECHEKMEGRDQDDAEVREHQRAQQNHQTQVERPRIDSLPGLLEGINSDDSMVLLQQT